jgi:hypothetical protein
MSLGLIQIPVLAAVVVAALAAGLYLALRRSKDDRGD